MSSRVLLGAFASFVVNAWIERLIRTGQDVARKKKCRDEIGPRSEAGSKPGDLKGAEGVVSERNGRKELRYPRRGIKKAPKDEEQRSRVASAIEPNGREHERECKKRKQKA